MVFTEFELERGKSLEFFTFMSKNEYVCRSVA